MQMITTYLWEQGECENNEDSLVLLQAETRKGAVLAAAVCDGIGGLAKGETASGYVAEMTAVWFHKKLLPMAQKGSGHKSLLKSAGKMLYEADEKLKEYGRKKGIRLGTTVTLLFIVRKNFYLVHIGDCRAYRMKRSIKALTKDDGNGACLYRCVGTGKWGNPQYRHGKIRGKTGFLLCSDGFYRKLDEEELYASAEPSCKEETALGRRMKEAGERIKMRGMRDNASAVGIVAGSSPHTDCLCRLWHHAAGGMDGRRDK